MELPRGEPNAQQIADVLDLLKDTDSVELKLTVPDTDQRSAVMSLDMDVLDAEIRQVVFFDTPDLKLNRSGMIVRVRRIRRGGDTVIKLRPVVPTELPTDLRHYSIESANPRHGHGFL
jgi:adenylate cyclase class IV